MSTMSSELDQQTRHVLEEFKVDSSRILTIKQLAYVRAAMIRVMASWENIGIYWGIDTSVLDVIKKKHRHNIDHCFTEMVAKWLQNGNQTQPTWEKVVIAISATTAGGDPAEAQKLAEKCQKAGVESLCTVPEANGVDEAEIGEEVTSEVMDALEPVSAKWSDIGVMLGLSYDFMQGLLGKDDIMDRIRSLVKKWLKKKFDFENFGVPSWKKLVEVIGAKAGGDNSAHALNIAKKHYAVTVKNSRKRAHSGQEEATDSGEHTNGADVRKIARLEGNTTNGAAKNYGNGIKISDADLTLGESSGNLSQPPRSSHNQSTTVSLQDLLDNVGITEDTLKQECTKEHLEEISEELGDQWEKYARCLITQKEIDDIKEDNKKVGEQRYKALLKWKQQKAFIATYFYLVENVFLKRNNAEMAKFVCKLLK